MRALCLSACLLAGCIPATPTTHPTPGPRLASDSASASEPAYLTLRQPGNFELARVWIRSLTVGNYEIGSVDYRRPSPDRQERLLLRITVENPTPNRKFDYHPLQKTAFGPVVLDEHGNQYRRISIDDVHPVEQASGGVLLPGQSVDDIVILEKPLPVATRFTLSISGLCFNQTGEAIWSFPAAAIRHGQ